MASLVKVCHVEMVQGKVRLVTAGMAGQGPDEYVRAR